MAKKTTTKKRVLYFDDEPVISGALAQSLELFDWYVIHVYEIDDLFKELKTRQYDIIIMDNMAPIPNKENNYINFSSIEIDQMKNGLNVGVVLSKKIWREFNKSIPILFLSAKKNPIPDEPEINNFKCDYLRKPQLAKHVDDKLREMLNK